LNLLTLVLYPFAILYDLVTAVRNRLYDLKLKPSAQFDLPVISVGNLAVGGTGKTPMIEHMIRLLSPEHLVATLSRGYKRSTTGFRIAEEKDSALTIGDEPFQFYKKYGNKVMVAVGEERAMAIPGMLDARPGIQVILMDDAFQHRKVKPSFQILLTDYKSPFYNDFLLPAGRLRESRKNAMRADVIVMSKCPSAMQEDEMISIEANIRKYSDKPVFFSSIRYGDLVPVNGKPFESDEVVLLTGIANSAPLLSYVNANYKLARHFNFPDHHLYTASDLTKIAEAAHNHRAAVITTEKDAAKIGSTEFMPFLSATPSFYLPIEVEFLKNGKDFDEMIINAVKNA
jgi:tetraacyldisaccharide 4'-kinase